MDATQSVFLINNGSATSSAAIWYGGAGVFSVVGTFSGATIKLQFLGGDNTTWIDVGVDTTLTAAGAGGFILPQAQIRAVVTGGPPSGIYAVAASIPE